MKLVWLLMYLVSFQSERVDEHERRSPGWASNSIKDIYFLIHLTCEWHIFNQLVAVYFSFKRWQLISMSTVSSKKNAFTSLSHLEIRQSSHFYFRMLHSVYDLCGEKYAIKQRKWNENQTYRDKKIRAHQAMRAFFYA